MPGGLGARMSMLLARTFVEELVHGFAWTVAETGPPERGNRHWNHWAPSGRFRVEADEKVDAMRILEGVCSILKMQHFDRGAAIAQPR